MGAILDNINLVIVLTFAIYTLLYYLFKNNIISFSDPFNLQLVLISCYLAGASCLIFIYGTNNTFIILLFLVVVFIATGSIVLNYRTKISCGFLLTSNLNIQLFFIGSITILLLTNLIVNYIFGFIPLLHGTESRALAGNKFPFFPLVVISNVLGYLVLFAAFICNNYYIRFISWTGIFIYVATSMLGGSKSALFYILLIILIRDYILSGKLLLLKDGADRNNLRKSIKRNRYVMLIIVLCIMLILPFYLVYIKAATNSTYALIGFIGRIFGGFDNLIYVALFDINHNQIDKLNLLQMWFYSLFKIFGLIPSFRTSGSYILYLMTGDYNYATSTLSPNSNLAVELLFSLNEITAFLMMIIISYLVFYVRRVVLNRREWKMVHLFLFCFIVTSPFTILLDGSYFITLFYLQMSVYIILNSLYNLLVIAKSGKLLYTFY